MVTPGTNPLRLAFEQFDNSAWTGGMVYIQNLLKALQVLDVSERPFTILSRRAGDEAYPAPVDLCVEIPPEPGPTLARRFRRRLAKQLGLDGAEKTIPVALLAQEVGALFTHRIYCGSETVRLIGWIPDFQHVHLPEMATPAYVENTTKYHGRLIHQSNVILVNSNDVLKDLEKFAPAALRKTHVVPFVADVPSDVYDANLASVCGKYGIPKRFLYLPNQFWKHKNHSVVIRALGILSRRSADVTVVCTGTTFDYRNPGYLNSLLTEVAMQGVHDRFRVLGLVPREDVFLLMRQSVAVVQPSLFEGWSTSVEECKSLGKRMILSDLAVHREQNPPGSIFFDPNSPEELATAMLHMWEDAMSGPDLALESEARANMKSRLKNFGARFVEIVRGAAK